MDAALRDALVNAVASDPTNVSLRVHVTDQLCAGGDLEAARELVREGLAALPADINLLTAAHGIAVTSGQAAEAAGYQSLLTALGAPVGSAANSAVGESPSAAAAAPPAPSLAPEVETPPTTPAPDSSHAAAAPPPWIADGANTPGPSSPSVPPASEPVPDKPIAPPLLSTPDSVDELLQMWDGTEPAEQPPIGELTKSAMTLVDVGGMHEVKKRLNSSFLAPMRNPEMRAAFGKSMKGGLLLWGPPGCGKTYIAKAVAGELGASFYHVGLSDVLDMFIGSSERNISALFDIARRNSPCVLFLDEVDALGQKRTSRGMGAMRGVVNQLLQEMDGALSDNEGVFILAATNHPWDIDSALLRPGRLDRMLLVLPPDRPARESILDLHLRGKPIEGLDLARLAGETDGLTGADLALLCEQATEYAMLDSIETGQVRPIAMNDLRRAAAEVRPSYGPWCDAAKNFALFNNDSGRYDELLAWLNTRRK